MMQKNVPSTNLRIEEDEAEDLLKEIEKQIKKRQWGEAIRLEVEEHVDKRLLKILKKELDMKEELKLAFHFLLPLPKRQ